MDQLTFDQVFWIVSVTLAVFICGSFGAYVANAKNRRWEEGFVFGAILGPFGIIAAACLPTRPPMAEAIHEPGPLTSEVQELSCLTIWPH